MLGSGQGANQDHGWLRASVPLAAALLAACGGGGGSAPFAPAPLPVVPTGDPIARVSAETPFTSGCNGAPQSGNLYINAEVEPLAVVNPLNPANLAVVWQQDRWSNGGSQGIMVGTSSDGGQTWSQRPLPHSRCAGGNAANGGNYQRASNPWLSFAPDGTLYELTLAFSGDLLADGSSSAQLLARSTDGGLTWSAPLALIADGASGFDDKGAVTADPNDAHFIYAVWDRITADNTGPAMLSRSTDGGASWSAAAVLYDPGADNQTISNVALVLADGSVVDSFVEIDNLSSTSNASIKVTRSTDHGATWSTPVKVADELSVGITDPDTGATLRTSTLIPSNTVGPDGTLYIAWQDARFSDGQHDGVILSHSSDGGLTWSDPVQVNGDPSVQAFSPAVKVRGDGEIGVSYYDFRGDTSSASTLFTSYWLAHSTDGASWSEAQVATAFNIDRAPLTTLGRFLGDYQSLLEVNGHFMPVYAQGNTSSSDDPTGIYAILAQSLDSHAASGYPARALEAGRTPTAEFRGRVQENLRHIVQARRRQPTR